MQDYFFDAKSKNFISTNGVRQPLKANIPLQLVTDDVNDKLQ